MDCCRCDRSCCCQSRRDIPELPHNGNDAGTHAGPRWRLRGRSSGLAGASRAWRGAPVLAGVDRLAACCVLRCWCGLLQVWR
eukprot:349763-Chlamydomonas_euryale.AAC.2